MLGNEQRLGKTFDRQLVEAEVLHGPLRDLLPSGIRFESQWVLGVLAIEIFGEQIGQPATPARRGRASSSAAVGSAVIEGDRRVRAIPKWPDISSQPAS